MFLIARRLMPDGVPRVPLAIIAVLLLWLPYVFFVGSFMEQSFLSQVVSELLAVAMWWTIACGALQPGRTAMALFALFGVGRIPDLADLGGTTRADAHHRRLRSDVAGCLMTRSRS